MIELWEFLKATTPFEFILVLIVVWTVFIVLLASIFAIDRAVTEGIRKWREGDFD